MKAYKDLTDKQLINLANKAIGKRIMEWKVIRYDGVDVAHVFSVKYMVNVMFSNSGNIRVNEDYQVVSTKNIWPIVKQCQQWGLDFPSRP